MPDCTSVVESERSCHRETEATSGRRETGQILPREEKSATRGMKYARFRLPLVERPGGIVSSKMCPGDAASSIKRSDPKIGPAEIGPGTHPGGTRGVTSRTCDCAAPAARVQETLIRARAVES